MIGQHPRFRPWRWPAEWLGLMKADATITCPGGGDGLGAQVMARLSAMIFAELHGLRYVHTPLQALDHTPAGVASGEWASRWESFLNYAAHECPMEARPFIPISKAHRLRPLSGRIYAVKHCHKITNQHPQCWSALRRQLRKNYYASPKTSVHTGPTIAVHIRRGDVDSQGENKDRFTPFDAIRARIELAVRQFPSPPRIKIYSQGGSRDFATLLDHFAADLHLNEDEFTTFHSLVSADALIMAKSSFSYLAALLSSGICIYEPFWHPRLEDWLAIERVTS